MVRQKTVPQKTVTPTNKPSPEKAAKKKRWRPGTVALREIKSLQRSTDLLIPKLPMARLIKEQSQLTAINRIKWKKEAINALHTATEDFLTELFKKMNQLAIARKAKTIMPQDGKTIKALGLL